MRATALRVATDLFCQAAAPLPADVSRYIDLALPLLDSVDRDTRRAVAEKLARIEHAPATVVARLRNDPDPFVSGAILASPTVFQPDDLSAFVARCTTTEAAATARRVDLTPAAIRTLATHRAAFVVEALIENPAIALLDEIVDHIVERAVNEPRLVAALLSRIDLAPARLAPLYADAPRPLREKIRKELAKTAAGHSAPVPASSLTELTEAFARPNRDGVGQALAHVLKLRPQRLPKLLDDPTAELFALALSAAGAKRAAAINILLIATPEDVRTSVQTIFDAVKVLDQTPRNVAWQIVTAVAGERRPSRPVVYEPHMHPSNTPQRVASRARRLAVQRDVSRVRSSGS